MATRTKTIEFAADTITTDLFSGTDRDVTVTIYIPEDTPVFTSCSLRCSLNGSSTNQLDDPVLGISTDGITFSETALADQPNSGEVAYYQLAADVTSYFTANFDGATPPTSVTWSLRFRAPSDTTSNHSFKLFLTYDYDDTDTTQIKTVRIPIESTRGALTVSFQTIGGATAIPAVEGSYLPETSVTVRQVWLELFAASGNTTSLSSTIRVDGTTETVWNITNSGISSYGQTMKSYIDITAEDLSTAVSLEAKTNNAGSPVINLGGFVCVTYEFNASTTATVFNSLVLPVPEVFHKSNSTTQVGQTNVRINIQEASPTLMESAIIPHFDYDDVRIQMGSQTITEFIATSTTAMAGDHTFVHRFDANGAKTAGFSLARGDNDFDISWSPDDTTGAADYQLFGMYMVLNYTSTKNTNGAGSHNHSVFTHFTDSSLGTDEPFTASAVMAETDYFINGILSETAFNNADRHNFSLQPERAMSEGVNQYVRDALMYGAENQAGEFRHSVRMQYLNHTHQFMRNPLDPTAELMDLTTDRNWRIVYSANNAVNDAIGLWTTYHGVTYAWDIAVTGYTGDGSGITFYIWHVDSNMLLATATTAIGGTASGVAYDNISDHRATAQQGVLAGASLEVIL